MDDPLIEPGTRLMATVQIVARTKGCRLEINVERDSDLRELVGEAYGLLLAGLRGFPELDYKTTGDTPSPEGSGS